MAEEMKDTMGSGAAGGAALPRAVVVVDAPNPRRAVARRSLRGFITPNYSLWLGGEQAVVLSCQGKVEMSPCWQSRNVPFCPGR